MHQRIHHLVLFVALLMVSSCFGHSTPEVQECQECQTYTQHPARSFVRILGVVADSPVMTASGAVIANDEVGSYILTAAHVCTFLEGSAIPPDLQAEKALILPHLSMHAQFFNGKMSPLLIVAYEEPQDLCIMFAPLYREAGIPIAKDLPEVDTKYRAISSPKGLAGPGRVFTFEGYYAGSYTMSDVKVLGDIYTLWNAQGGSGSPILNQSNQIVGIISRVLTDGTPAVISPTTKALQTFVQTALCEEEVEGYCSEPGD
jgi:hypothetical protein